MIVKQKLNLSNFRARSVKSLDDLTLRNIIFQVYAEWNSSYSRWELEIIAKEALFESV